MSDDIEPEIYDPCVEAPKLRQAYLKVLRGESVRGVRYKNGEEERETTFAPSNIELLRAAMIQAEGECSATTTGRPRRHAIAVGRRGRKVFTY